MGTMKFVDEDESKLKASAAIISRHKKSKFLQLLSEDEFHDRVIRPLFIRLGYLDGRDLCGRDEKGKDVIFLSPTPLGTNDILAVQTKKGNLTLVAKARDNLINAVTQLRMAIETSVVFIKTKEKKFPSKVMLCVSGKINDPAQRHIIEAIQDPRLEFLDSDDLIPLIDNKYPDLWLNIDSEIMPYMKGLRRFIEQSSESIAISEILPEKSAAATDSMFVEIRLWRSILRLRRQKGKTEQIPAFIEIPVTAIVGKPERLVLILGEAGTGKSTSIKRLAYVLSGKALSVQSDFIIPVLLRAVDLVKYPNRPIVDAAFMETQRISGSTKPVFGSSALQNGRVVLLIDALDEVSDDENRKRVIKLIFDFNSLYPDCLVVLTSREYAFLKNIPELTGFTRYRIEHISFKQAEKLVEKLETKGSLPVDTSKEIVRRLENIHGMELNPLLVTVFAATSESNRKDIPANITELFKKFTKMMLGRWDATKGFTHQFHAPLKDFILCRIAFNMHLNKETHIELNDFRSRIAAELRHLGHQADATQLMDEILNRVRTSSNDR